MIIHNYIIASNPFIDAYIHSDFLGKSIFLGLIFLSVVSWVILVDKVRIMRSSRLISKTFQKHCDQRRHAPLTVEISEATKSNPFERLYLSLKKQTVDLLNKNRHFVAETQKGQPVAYLSPADIDLVGGHMITEIASETKQLERNLYILATIVSLAPFLGLLGTVWGILTSFSEMQAQVGSTTNQAVLGGISLALATTVLGLIDAIPALIGYNYLKSAIRDFEIEMESFTSHLITSIELQYRQVDVRSCNGE